MSHLRWQRGLRHEPVNRSHSTVAHGIDIGPDLVLHLAGGEHGLGLCIPVTRLVVSICHLLGPTGTVLSVLFDPYARSLTLG